MQRAHRKAHAWIWTALAVAIPLCVVMAIAKAPTLSRDAPSVRLDPGSQQEH